MVLADPDGFTRTNLDELELKMLQAEEIPGLLPVEWQEIDGMISFHYKLAGKRMLTHRLQLQTFTMSDYCVLLMSVLEALENCRPFMLRTEAVMLHEDYIFIGSSWQEIGLVYVPVTVGASHASPHGNLMNLAVRWAAYINSVDGPALQRILQTLDKETGTWSALRKLLLEMISAPYYQDAVAAPDPQPNTVFQIHGSDTSYPIPNAMLNHSPAAHPSGSYAGSASDSVYKPFVNPSQKALSSVASHATNNAAPEQADSRMHLRAANLDEEISGGDSGPDVVSKKPRTTVIIVLLAFFAIAVVWRFVYLDDPGRHTLLISSGITLLIAGSALLFCYAASKNSRHKEQADETVLNEQEAGVMRHRNGEPGLSVTRGGNEIKSEGQLSNIGHQHNAAANEGKNNRWNFNPDRSTNHLQSNPSNGYGSTADNPFSMSPMESASLRTDNAVSADEATVLLAPDGRAALSQISGQMVTAYLQREFKGQVSRVELSGGKLVIGRAAESAGYVDAGEGLSRAHLEIDRTTEGYSAKDLGSRNGSLLNGKVMVPYKVYMLKPEDQLQLAGTQGPVYAFKESHKQAAHASQGGAHSAVGT
nr:DUF6382 domain-containing protein [Paenibacillus roseus]